MLLPASGAGVSPHRDGAFPFQIEDCSLDAPLRERKPGFDGVPFGLTTLVKDTFRTAALASTANTSASERQSRVVIPAIRHMRSLVDPLTSLVIRDFPEHGAAPKGGS